MKTRFIPALAAAALLVVGLPAVSHAASGPEPVSYTRYDFGGKTHYYVDFGSSDTYDQALTYATNTTFKGLTGHLPTVTSSAENAALARVAGRAGRTIWLGLADRTHDENQSPSRTWKWTAGPEAGSTLTSCLGWLDSDSCQYFGFNNWNEYEPNNSNGEEDVAEMYSNGTWNDTAAIGYCYDDDYYYDGYPCPATRRVIVEYNTSSVAAPEAKPSTSNIAVNTFFRSATVTWDGLYDGGDDVSYTVTITKDLGTYVDECVTTQTSCTFTLPYGDYSATVIATTVNTQVDSDESSTDFSTHGWINASLPGDAFTIVAAAPRADVLFDTGDWTNTTHEANGTAWYYSTSTSWGFAKAGDLVQRSSCDIGGVYNDYLHSGARLCWHTSGGNLNDGWRAGTYSSLWNNTYRAVYQSNNPSYYPAGPQPNVTQQVLANGGWTLCFSATYGDRDIPLRLLMVGLRSPVTR